MNPNRLSFALSAAIGISTALTGCGERAAAPETAPTDATQSDTVAQAENPFFTASTLQYQYPPFNKITDDHYLPAFERGMADHLNEIEVIANSTDPASFDNSIIAMERTGQLLTRVSNVFFNLVGTNTNDKLDAIQTELAPKLAAHRDTILLNGKLFERVSKLYETRDMLNLSDEDKRLVERYYTDFVRSGAKLDDAQKEQLKSINAQIASLMTTFSQNVLKGTNEAAVTVDSREQLAGLSDNAIAAAAETAKERKLDGKFVIAMMNTSGQPSLDALTNRELREKIQQASVNRGTSGGQFDNREVIAKLAKLRAERAVLLGYPNHAAYVLEDETAQTTDAVNKLLNQLAPAAVSNAKREAADMQKLIDEENGGFELAAHDWSFYAEKVRAQRYAFDESQLKPYFELNNVLENGLFFAMGKLYGLTFKARPDLPVYQSDIRVWEVFDHDGSSLGLFVGDFYARSNKRGGAWMNEYVSQSGLFGNKAVVGNHLNIPKPPEGEPTLMTFDEVNTLFHEFGHAVHGLFSNVKYPRFAGTNVPRDFVEYPSQVHEMWSTWPEVLENYAKHHQTGEPMPKELLDKVLASEKFNQGFTTTEYLAASLLDQAFHQITPDKAPSADEVLNFEANALKAAGVDYAPVPPRYRSGYFSHVFGGGYDAGYYAYLWSEVLDAESVEWFKENGGLTRANGDHFRKTLLSKGGSIDAMQLFRDFRGREPKIDPLLERRGLN